TVNGNASQTLTTGQGAHWFSDGTNYTANQGAAVGAGSGTISTCGSASTGTCAMPYFSAYLSANQTGVSSNTFTKIQFNTKTGTASGQYDGATNYRFTPTLAGTYLISSAIYCDGTSVTGVCLIAIYKNGSNVFEVALSGPSSF